MVLGRQPSKVTFQLPVSCFSCLRHVPVRVPVHLESASGRRIHSVVIYNAQVRRTTGVLCVTSLLPRRLTWSPTWSSTQARRISSVITVTSCSCGGRTSSSMCSSTHSKLRRGQSVPRWRTQGLAGAASSVSCPGTPVGASLIPHGQVKVGEQILVLSRKISLVSFFLLFISLCIYFYSYFQNKISLKYFLSIFLVPCIVQSGEKKIWRWKTPL